MLVCVCVRVCVLCKRWFRSRGGLAVHRCRQEDDADGGASGAGILPVEE